VAESCTICNSRSRRPVRKFLGTPLYDHIQEANCYVTISRFPRRFRSSFRGSEVLHWFVVCRCCFNCIASNWDAKMIMNG